MTILQFWWAVTFGVTFQICKWSSFKERYFLPRVIMSERLKRKNVIVFFFTFSRIFLLVGRSYKSSWQSMLAEEELWSWGERDKKRCLKWKEIVNKTVIGQLKYVFTTFLTSSFRIFLMWLFKIINYSKLQNVASFNFKHLFTWSMWTKKIEITPIELVGRKKPSVFVKLFCILVIEICLIVRESFLRIYFELVKKNPKIEKHTWIIVLKNYLKV